MPDLSKLNEAQRRAVTWGGGPLLVLAGPGSGKTTVIVGRVLYLLERGVPPESVLVITFTRDAALSMQQRFQNACERTQPVSFGTFHSVFYRILRESGGVRQRNLLTESQKKHIMTALLRQIDDRQGSPGNEQLTGVDNWRGMPDSTQPTGFCDRREAPAAGCGLVEEAEKLLCAVSLYKNTGDLDRAQKLLSPGRQGTLEKILREYREAVRRTGALDFDDMLYECRRLLQERADVRKRWQERFSHILIDEFQDCNPMQYETLKLLAGEARNVFAVGDDDQSIYGFRGACPDVLRRFAEEFHGGKILLNVNYRSRERIVKASLAVIGENRNRFSKELRASEQKTAEQKTSLRVLSFEGKEQQYAYLCEQLKRWQERQGREGKRCALLFRTNAHMQGVAVRLSGVGISYVMKEKRKSIYEHFIVKDVMAYLLLAAGDWQREYLLRVLDRPARYVGREAVGEGRSIGEMIRWYRTADGLGTGSAAGCRRALGALEELERQLKCLGRLSPGLAVNYVLKGMRYEVFLQNAARGNPEKSAEWRELLEWLKEDAARFPDVRAWRRAQEEYTQKVSEREVPSGRENEESPILLMSVHGSKGLEFDRVLIPDCNEHVFPHGSLPDEETVEEERRIFYVAMTRAKESLELLYLTGDKARPRLPSRFLNPLLHSSSSISSSNSQLSRYSSKASATRSYSSSSSM